MPQRQLEHEDHQGKTNRFPLVLLADNLDSATNVGSLFRLADAMGIAKLWLTGSTPCPPNKKLAKSARSTARHVAYEYAESAIAVIEKLKTEGYGIIALELTDQSVDLATMNFHSDEKLCLILGAEKYGVSQDLLNITDHCIHIPMLGHNSSMNVAMAAAIAMYEITRQLKLDHD